MSDMTRSSSKGRRHQSYGPRPIEDWRPLVCWCSINHLKALSDIPSGHRWSQALIRRPDGQTRNCHHPLTGRVQGTRCSPYRAVKIIFTFGSCYFTSDYLSTCIWRSCEKYGWVLKLFWLTFIGTISVIFKNCLNSNHKRGGHAYLSVLVFYLSRISVKCSIWI
jgi:hypothetical protein